MQMPFRRIRDRTLALVFLASLLPVVLLGVFVGARVKNELTAQALRTQERVAEAIRQGIFIQLRAYSRQLLRLASEPTVQSMLVERQRETIYRFLDQNSSFFSVFVFQPDGTVHTLAYRNRFAGDDPLIGQSVLDPRQDRLRAVSEAFRKVVTTRELAVNESISFTGQRTELLVLLPVFSFHDPQRLVGVISCGLNIDGVVMQELIEGFGGASGFLLLTDSKGNILARKGNGIPVGLTRARCDRLPVGSQFESTRVDLQGQEYFVTIGPIPGVNGYILLAAPTSEVLGFVSQTLWGMAMLTLISLVVALCFGLWSANEFSGPIAVLLQGIRQVADGVISYRIGPEAQGDGELAEACRAFNDMAGQLEKNHLIEEIWSRTWKPPS